MEKNELKHYGVLGMKWGVRRKRTPSADSVRAKNLRKKKTSELSNQELKELNNRLQLEQNHKNLTKRRNVIDTAAKTVIATAGTITALEAASRVYKKYGNIAIDKIGDWVVKDIRI